MKNHILEISKAIKEKELALFCGAGISKNSGLPLANELKRYILEKLPIEKEDRDEIMKSALPFEAFIEAISENVDISKILDIFEAGELNTNHILIAKLVKNGFLKTIFTTNFDLLIEKALEKEGLKRDIDFEVYYDEEQFSKIDFDNVDDKVIRIFKIHGSVENKDSIRTTIKAVASKTLSDKRMNLIKYLFSTGLHKKVLILGYSCSDEFDITPQIQSIDDNQKEIISIDYSDKEEKVRDIKVKEFKNPFKRFNGIRIIYALDKLIKDLWNSFTESIGEYNLVKSEVKWEKCVDDWGKGLGENKEYIKYFIVGFLFSEISNFKKAIEYHKEALRIDKDIGDKAVESKCYANLGAAYHDLGYFKEAIEYNEKSLEITKEIGDKAVESKCYMGLGNAYYSSEDFRKVIEYYLKAEKMFIDLGQNHYLKMLYENLSIVYKNSGDTANAGKYQRLASLQ